MGYDYKAKTTFKKSKSADSYASSQIHEVGLVFIVEL